MTTQTAVVAVPVSTPCASTTPKRVMRRFEYEKDLQDLQDICANVYGGSDYIPRIIHRIAGDPGHLVLAVEADSAGGPAIDGVICSERRGGAVFLYGLRVREGSRGSGLGHLLMEAICASTPEVDAAPPAGQQQSPSPHDSAAATNPPSHPHDAAASATAPLLQPSGAPLPISHIVTCTTSYNPAAQRIIGRQLYGPLCEVEIWPGHEALVAYEAAVGRVPGVGLPPGAPRMVDWIEGARQALEADAAAQALLPRWRRVASDAELRSAVTHLLYGRTQSGDACGGGSSNGDGAGGDCGGGSVGISGRAVAGGNGTGGGRDGAEGAVTLQDCLTPLLWLPMPYDVWPLDSPFVRREVGAGNVWLLTAPPAAGQPGGGRGGRGCEVAADNGIGGSKAGDATEEEREEVVGVMLLAYFATMRRVCAGILARDNAAAHAAIAHAGSLEPEFLASILRRPASVRPPQPGAAPAGATGYSAAASERSEQGDLSARPALYDATGGFRDFWVYGRPVAGECCL